MDDRSDRSDRTDRFERVSNLLDTLIRRIEDVARSWESEGRSNDRRGLDLSMRNTTTTMATPGATSLDLADEDGTFVVTVDVPGYESADLEIRLSGQTLSIKGEREREADYGTNDRYIRREREVQSFSRQLRLPQPVAGDGVSATVNNGVLTIRIPKRESEAESTTIDIE